MRAKQPAELALFEFTRDVWERLRSLRAIEFVRIMQAVPHGATLIDFDSDTETVYYVNPDDTDRR